MTALSLDDPLFATYVVAATLVILKAVSMSWLTVVRMMREKGGFRSPEDIRKTPFNPLPSPAQLAPNDRVDRIRRIQQNDLESLPYFLVAAVFFIGLAWQCSPAKQVCLNRCHALRELAAFGRAADTDALIFGATQGVWCAGSCWAWMLLPLLLPGGRG